MKGILIILDLFVRGVGLLGIWAIHISWWFIKLILGTTFWVADIAAKIAWTLVLGSIEAVIILFAVIFLKGK